MRMRLMGVLVTSVLGFFTGAFTSYHGHGGVLTPKEYFGCFIWFTVALVLIWAHSERVE